VKRDGILGDVGGTRLRVGRPERLRPWPGWDAARRQAVKAGSPSSDNPEEVPSDDGEPDEWDDEWFDDDDWREGRHLLCAPRPGGVDVGGGSDG
jgi:hypothetical protein